MIITDIPAVAPTFQGTDYVWHYYMEPQQGVCMGIVGMFELKLINIEASRGAAAQGVTVKPTVCEFDPHSSR